MHRSKMQNLGKKQKATGRKNTGLQATVLVNETSAEHRGNSPLHVRDENSTQPLCSQNRLRNGSRTQNPLSKIPLSLCDKGHSRGFKDF